MDARARDLNVIGNYLAERDLEDLSGESLKQALGAEQSEMIILFGGSIPHGCRLAGQAYQQGLCKALVIVGGVGHTTPYLRRELSRAYPQLKVEGRAEADLIADYLRLDFGIPQRELIVENRSSNCGENVAFARELLKRLDCVPENAVIMQDSSMQRRMKATFQKEWREERTRIFSYAAYRAEVVSREERLAIANSNLWGMWDIDRWITLLMGEIPRLRDDRQGYGPRGKGFIAHVDIPPEVEQAYGNLLPLYGGAVRPPWEEAHERGK